LVVLLNLPQGKISRHLAVLKNATLVSDRRDGTWIYYSLFKANTGLKRKLHNYLRQERIHLQAVTQDIARLHDLADQDKICVPKPSLPTT